MLLVALLLLVSSCLVFVNGQATIFNFDAGLRVVPPRETFQPSVPGLFGTAAQFDPTGNLLAISSLDDGIYILEKNNRGQWMFQTLIVISTATGGGIGGTTCDRKCLERFGKNVTVFLESFIFQHSKLGTSMDWKGDTLVTCDPKLNAGTFGSGLLPDNIGYGRGSCSVLKYNYRSRSWSNPQMIRYGVKNADLNRVPTHRNLGQSVKLSSDTRIMFVGDPSFNSSFSYSTPSDFPKSFSRTDYFLNSFVFGTVFIFTYDNAKRSYQPTSYQRNSFLRPNNSIGGNVAFGTSLDFKTNTANNKNSLLVVGAPADNQFVGATWVYTVDEPAVVLTQFQKLVGSDAYLSRQGQTVSLSIDLKTIVVGGSQDGSMYVGAVWIFYRDSTNQLFAQLGSKLTPNNCDYMCHFGYSVSLSQDSLSLMVGSPNYKMGQGAVYYFIRSSSSSSFSFQSSYTPPELVNKSLKFGSFVQLASDRWQSIVSAPEYDNHASSYSVTGAWIFTQAGTFTPFMTSQSEWQLVNNEYEGDTSAVSSASTFYTPYSIILMIVSIISFVIVQY